MMADAGAIDREEQLRKLRSDVLQQKRRVEELRAGEQPNSRERRELQKQLEDDTHRLTELGELERVDIVRQVSVASGMVELAVALQEEVPECPLCFEEISVTFAPEGCDNFSRLWCCGAIVCYDCQDKIQGGCARCPFCKRLLTHAEDRVSYLRRNAEEGKTWAQRDYGIVLGNGIGACGGKDRKKGAEFLALAADKGDVFSMVEVSKMLFDGFPELGEAPSSARALKYLHEAGRKGHVIGQRNMGKAVSLSSTGRHNILAWFTLSASQGDAEAQGMVGEIYMTGKCGVKPSPFVAMYWLRQAALRNCQQAQRALAICLIATKAEIFDGNPDVVGYSAKPEAIFWYELSIVGHANVPRPTPLQIVACGCCKKREADDTKLRRCVKCWAVAYCCRDCQVKHWKMGHKRDCSSIDKWKDAMKLAVETMPWLDRSFLTVTNYWK